MTLNPQNSNSLNDPPEMNLSPVTVSEKIRSGGITAEDVYMAPVLPPGYKQGYDKNSHAYRIRVAGSVGRRYQQELILQIIHEMTLKDCSVEQIARETDLSIPVVEKYKRNLHKYYRAQAKKIDILPYIGKTDKMMDSIITKALETFEETEQPADKVRILNLLRQTEESRTKIFETAGVFDGMNFSGTKRVNAGAEGAEALKEMAAAFLKTAAKNEVIEAERVDVQDAEYSE